MNKTYCYRFLAVMLSVILPGLAPRAFAQDIRPMPKAAFLAAFQNKMPEALCSDSSVFMKCLGLTKSVCMQQASTFVADCIRSKDAEIPAVITNKDQAKKIGQSVGYCAGVRFGQTYTKNSAQVSCMMSGGSKSP